MTDDQLLIRVEAFQNLLVDIASGGSRNEEANGFYESQRRALLKEPTIQSDLPRLVKTCRSLQQFWEHVKKTDATYQGRKDYLWDAFRPLIDRLEGVPTSPADASVSASLLKLDAEHVREAWDKALVRRYEDPEGAITSARTLLETVCKHILEAEGVAYQTDASLSDLCKATARELNLAPEQHQEPVFKQILSGCYTVVGGLAALRNGLSDAHGKPSRAVKPAPRHARLAVDLAGSISAFFADTWEETSRR